MRRDPRQRPAATEHAQSAALWGCSGPARSRACPGWSAGPERGRVRVPRREPPRAPGLGGDAPRLPRRALVAAGPRREPAARRPPAREGPHESLMPSRASAAAQPGAGRVGFRGEAEGARPGQAGRLLAPLRRAVAGTPLGGSPRQPGPIAVLPAAGAAWRPEGKAGARGQGATPPPTWCCRETRSRAHFWVTDQPRETRGRGAQTLLETDWGKLPSARASRRISVRPSPDSNP